MNPLEAAPIVWIGERAGPRTRGAVRIYELLRRFTFLTRIGLPAWRGVWRLEPLLAWIISFRPKSLFCANPSLIPYWHGSVIVDIPDPTFSKSEIALLNSSNVQVVVTTTEQLRTEFLRHGLVRPIEVVPSGYTRLDLDHQFTELLARTYNPEDHPVVGYDCHTLELPGNQPTQGDISVLVRAMEAVWAEMEQVQLWLVGDPTREVERWAARNPQVRLLGWVPRSKLASYIQNFTVGTYPRRLDHRGRFSIKLIEYMAHGVPVVGTAVSETEIVLRANAGILAETPVAFAEAILGILRDTSRWKLFKANGLQFAAAYDWDRIAADYHRRIFSTIP